MGFLTVLLIIWVLIDGFIDYNADGSPSWVLFFLGWATLLIVELFGKSAMKNN